MQLILNQNSEITDYVLVGITNSGIEFNGAIPSDFEENFKPHFYSFKNREIVINPDYEDPVFELPEKTGPTAEQVMINQLGLKYAELAAKVGKLEGGGSNG